MMNCTQISCDSTLRILTIDVKDILFDDKTGIRTTRYLDISVLNICDISVLGTGHFGTE